MIRIVLFLVATSLTGIQVPAEITSLSVSETPSEVQIEIGEQVEISEKEIVMDYFKDTPIMIDIAFCESSFRHFDSEGNVLRGKSNNQDVGMMQINEKFHLEKSQKLGIDIYTLQGNLEFAMYLYGREGVRPWNASKDCWA